VLPVAIIMALFTLNLVGIYNLSIKTKNDLDVISGKISGDTVILDVGGNINLETLKVRRGTVNNYYEELRLSVSGIPYTGIVIMCIGLDLTGIPSGDTLLTLLALSSDTLLNSGGEIKSDSLSIKTKNDLDVISGKISGDTVILEKQLFDILPK
jgi:hypothetical protein